MSGGCNMTIKLPRGKKKVNSMKKEKKKASRRTTPESNDCQQR